MDNQEDLTDPEMLTKRVRLALEKVMRCSTCGKLRTQRPTGYGKEILPGGMPYLFPNGIEPFNPEIHCSGHNDVQLSEKKKDDPIIMQKTYYHITLSENVVSLLTKGADSSCIGANSLKAGPGFHLAQQHAWAEEWGRELFYHPSPPGPQTTILQVTLPDTARIARGRDEPERGMLERWGKQQGYLERDGSPSGKLLQLAHEENWPENSNYFLAAMNEGVYCALLGAYLTARDFDGYWVDNDLVVTNFSLLGPEAFTRATGMHHQHVTIQDAATGSFLTLKLSPRANGLMVYCYPGEQTSGEPLASFQAASYNDQLEILYWEAAMSDEQDPKRVVLAEHIPPQHQSVEQPTKDQSE